MYVRIVRNISGKSNDDKTLDATDFATTTHDAVSVDVHALERVEIVLSNNTQITESLHEGDRMYLMNDSGDTISSY